MKFERSFLIVMTMMRENIEECPYVIETFTSDIGHLENGAYSLTDKLRRCLDSFLTSLDEDWDLPCPWGFEDARKLHNSLLQDLWRANIDFGNNDHDRHLQCERDPEVFSDCISVCMSQEMIDRNLLAHPYYAIVRRNHEQTVVRAAAKQPEHCGSKVAFVTC